MTQTPDEVLLAPNGGLPTANYPKAELVKFIRATPAREAADDMLAALSDLRNWLFQKDDETDVDEDLTLLERVDASIAKAKGETK